MNKKGFQLKTNRALANKCLDYIANKYEQVRGIPKLTSFNMSAGVGVAGQEGVLK